MGGFSLFRSASLRDLIPISNADLCVFCCYFFSSVVLVLVSCCGSSSMRWWWGGMWGVDGWVGRRWMG